MIALVITLLPTRTLDDERGTRLGEVDVIDWIEHILLRETAITSCVAESIPVYEAFDR